ncbi:MAG: histidine ammonia-lyase [Ignavibacteriales bacterium]|nr:histidine ammonia-lyase [Ignavibacteriales bacterium]
MSLTLDGNSLTIEQLYVASTDAATKISLSPKAKKAMQRSRALVEEWLEKDEVIYGVTTGFGEFANVRIPFDKIEELQTNLIKSHAAGAGDPLPPEIVRAMIILRVNALAKGFSGIRPETVEFIVKFFNAGFVPVVPSQGSVGSSGDLVQLAHLVLTMMGKGKLYQFHDSRFKFHGSKFENPRLETLNLKLEKASTALKKLNLSPLKLTAKEGLALINGTQMMTAFAGLIIHEAGQLTKLADIACALSVEALKGTDTAFDERIHKLRPYKGQLASAKNLRALMKGSEIRESHRFNDDRVQDAYSLRCAPQVHGASRDALEYVVEKISIEINSANDNPLIFPKEKQHLEGGNFHGQPMALAMDFAAIALSELANISERRTERMVNGALSRLPRFLTQNGGLNSGLMIAQYTAASLVSENKVLSHPASVDSIPTSANQEDHNSMGSIAAQKCWRILKNVQTVLAIELLTAAQAIDFHAPLKCGKGTNAAYQTIRKHISHLDDDRILHDDIQKSLALVKEGRVLTSVEKSIGILS